MAVSLCCRRFPLSLKSRFLQTKRHGYIVLLPEIGPNIPEIVLTKDNMPDFTNLTTEKCVMTLGKHLLDYEHGLRALEERIEKSGCTDVIKEVIEPLEKITAGLDTSWGIVKNMYFTDRNIMPGSHYLPVHNRATKARNLKYFSKVLYDKFKECDPMNMTEEEQRIIEKHLLEGRLAGLDLTADKREQLSDLHYQMQTLFHNYSKRITTSATIWTQDIYDPDITREMPDELLKLMAKNKEEPNQGPWTISLDPFVLDMFLEYCPDRNLRMIMWQGSTRVAQYVEDSELRNSHDFELIRDKRMQQAQLLGYPNYSYMSMETKMAGSLENVQQTLNHLLQYARPAADREVANLQQYAWERGFTGNLEIYDVYYWQRKQKRTLFNYKEDALKDFLPLDKVLGGLLGLCERMFGIRFVEDEKVDRWHKDVKFFYIYEESDKPIAGFYLDPFIRESKILTYPERVKAINISPAARTHKTLPLSTLLMQLEPPIYGKPALLAWADVKALFEQFGQLMQQLLTTVNYAEVAGQSNIEWDAVEIVGNVFLHWLREPEVLGSISSHYVTGEKLPPLPMADIEKHFAAFFLCEELFKARVDLDLYTWEDFWQDIMKVQWQAHFILPHDKANALPCSFSEIVTGHWPASYYSHVWARMVAADVYSAFTEPDVDIKSVGERFRDTYLAFGGSCPAGEVFRRFRGRDPSPEAFLKHLGLH